MKRILFVDDNPDILLALIDYFSNRDWITDSCGNGAMALNLLSTNEYDILVLDVTMPGMSGIEVCRRLRDEGNLIPILMLTARDSNDDVVTGLEAGADDYLIKPFELKVLKARIEALLRRSQGMVSTKLQVGDLVYDTKSFKVSRAGVAVNLNPTCLKILKLLMRASPAVVSRREMIDAIWGEEAPETDSLRANIYLLRNEIDKNFDSPLIHTHPSLGWSLSEKKSQS